MLEIYRNATIAIPWKCMAIWKRTSPKTPPNYIDGKTSGPRGFPRSIEKQKSSY